MKVLTEGAGVGTGGISRYVQEVLASWPEGDELRFVTGDAELARSIDGRVGTTVVPGGGRARTIAGIGRATVTIAKSWRPDVVISFAPSFPAPLTGRPGRVVVLHDLFFRIVPAMISAPQRGYRAAAYRSSLRAADRVVCVSERTAHDLACWIPGMSAKSVVVANAAADTFHRPPRWNPPSGQMRLVAPAHNELKGATRVLNAVAELPHVHLDLLAGSPARVSQLAEQVRQSGLADRVVVLGRLAESELRERIVSSSALVMASDVEGFGLPALEAMAMDVPIVVSPDPALREATNGFAVTMANWGDAALVSAIDHLAELPESHWRAAGRWARSRGWADVASELRDAGAACSAPPGG